MLKIVGNPKKGFQFVQNTKYMKIQKVHKDAKMARMEMDYDFGKKVKTLAQPLRIPCLKKKRWPL